MNKVSCIYELFDNLKDKLEFDEDATALFKILKIILKIDKKQGVEKWLYLMNIYSLKTLKKEIDFTPLTNKFLIELLNYQSLEETLDLIATIPLSNQAIIEHDFFNVFNKQSGIYQYFQKIIKQKHFTQEITSIELIVKNQEQYNPLTFNLTTFLKNIISIHIDTKNIKPQLLLKIADFPNTSKDKALLKTVFIDYI